MGTLLGFGLPPLSSSIYLFILAEKEIGGLYIKGILYISLGSIIISISLSN
jgi:hypothetical protein